ncbi:MAG: hypothetical protein ABSA21_10470 [Candidatus Limnocylindrales bacterium]|jgi:hypothetical protein
MRRVAVALLVVGLVAGCSAAGSTPSATAPPAAGLEHLYWANHHAGTIGRANLDGTGVNQSFITGANAICGLAIVGDYIYWGNIDGGIGRANLDGTEVNQRLIDTTAACILASDGKYLYWGNPSPSSNSIERANLDGTGVKGDFISMSPVADGIAVSGSYIYWGCLSCGAIGRANLDGTGVNDSFISGGAPVFTGPEGIAFSGGFIYWANCVFEASHGGSIGRAKLDGTGVNQTFITGGTTPTGLAIGP